MVAMSRIVKFSLVAMALSATMSNSYAFTDSEARTAIIELRQQLRTLTETSQRASMQLAQRIDRLEQEITRLRAQLEELGAPQGAGQQSGSAVPERAQDSKEQAAFDGARQGADGYSLPGVLPQDLIDSYPGLRHSGC